MNTFESLHLVLSQNSSQFLLHCATPSHRGGQEKLYEVETTALILVEYREDLVHHFICVAFTRTCHR